MLGDTHSGLSGSNIAKVMRGYGLEMGVNVPHPNYPFEAPNKRTALLENLQPFCGSQQHRIIRELCDHHALPLVRNPERERIKVQLATTYADFAATPAVGKVSEEVIENTRHWLDGYPEARDVYVSAAAKYGAGVFTRNLLDDLRVALELLLKDLLANGKSLENQVPALGAYIKARGGSPQLGNMFAKLVDYYCTYQNSYIKHGDAVKEPEIEFILELTSAFMKHVIRINRG